MSIASEIQRIQTNISNAYSACDSKGATMPQTQNSANLTSCINSIPAGGGEVSGTITITENGAYDVASYAGADVNVNNNTLILNVIDNIEPEETHTESFTFDASEYGNLTPYKSGNLLFYAFEWGNLGIFSFWGQSAFYPMLVNDEYNTLSEWEENYINLIGSLERFAIKDENGNVVLYTGGTRGPALTPDYT